MAFTINLNQVYLEKKGAFRHFWRLNDILLPDV